MDLLAAGGIGIAVIFAIGAAVIALIIVIVLIRAWYRVAKADEALVIVGKSQKNAQGDSSRITVITGGGAIVNP
ncbi:hypothetical protein GCM10025874_16070 [Arenivirga flava]|uniref:Flotillin n=1 Tax=Arenivirga flava TaxID=1930060 RepID=A0AA37UGA1_9MICO|nr:hypothetical protein [Arenivirga flava]GMA28354.1 hypothetical protein GCM10025874_16070 [Arenivirga flava]